jgi:adiponectin receptor
MGYPINLTTLHSLLWGFDAGFLIFMSLTAAVYYRPPSSLSIGRDLIHAIESKWETHSVSENLYDVMVTAAAWEKELIKFGADQLKSVEEILKSINRQNIQDMSGISETFKSIKNKLSEYKDTGIDELMHVEEVVSNFSHKAFHDAEIAVYKSLCSLVGVKWPVHRWPMYIFTFGAMICLLTSSVCHLFGCCSAHIAMLMWQFDYAGIAVLIVASFFPPVYYGFLCRPIYVVLYLSLVSIFGIATIAVTLTPKFQDPSYHAFRAGVFTSLGLFGIIPVVHGWRIHSNVAEVHDALVLDLVMGVTYLLGAAIYTFKIPERWWPGAFDVIFHSHQLFHVAVVVAAMIHYKACNLMIMWRDSSGACITAP